MSPPSLTRVRVAGHMTLILGVLSRAFRETE
jgi:hypothetical protein